MLSNWNNEIMRYLVNLILKPSVIFLWIFTKALFKNEYLMKITKKINK